MVVEGPSLRRVVDNSAHHNRNALYNGRMAATPQRAARRSTSKPTTDGQLGAPTIPTTDDTQFGRVVIMDITPCAEQGRYPARVELGEPFTVSAQVFMEGRATVGATAVLRNPRGKIMQRLPMTCINQGLDRWTAVLYAGTASDCKPWQDGYAAVKRQLGLWTVTIEGWEDSYRAWLHDARIKVQVNDDVDNALHAGIALLRRWANDTDAALGARERKTVLTAAEQLADTSLDPAERLSVCDSEVLTRIHREHPLRDALSCSAAQRVRVERPASSFAAWYQFFPRSEGATFDTRTQRMVPGTLRTALQGLQRAADEGFDIVYLPPIFPIGVTNRKGRNNALVAGPDDPGSPFGIGSELGGHDTVDPLLGTMEDFRAFTARAHELGLEIALDFALQCSPDHPWVREHPNWFRHKSDGSIAFAENPPKKYQDIYPIDFNEDMAGIEREVIRILTLWIEAGVTIFRVDNPHTKPVRFWQDVIAAITAKHPEVLFLAEAFTRPGMMRALSYVGFTQSHCYFPWRNTKEELDEYLATTNSDAGYYQHNTFWPTTPDILTAYVRDNGIAGHAVRAVLAALGSPSWGIYNGYELIENRQRVGVEEQADNEKYEIKVRDWSQAKRYGIAQLLTALNRIRHAHPCTRSYHNLTVLPTSNEHIVAFARHTPSHCLDTAGQHQTNDNGRGDTLIVVVNLDGHNAQQATVDIDMTAIGLRPGDGITVRDELTGRTFTWGEHNFVSLAPWADVAHILTVV